MKKISCLRILAVIFLLISLFIISCIKKEDDGKKTLLFSFWGSPDQISIEREIIDKFEAAHPDIKIKTLHIPSASRYGDKILTMIAGGTPPDVMFIHITTFPNFADSGRLLDIQDLIKRDIPQETLNDLYPAALDLFTYNEKIYGIARDISSWVIFYNKKIFDEAEVAYPSPAWTWQKFEDACKKITRDIDGDGVLDVYGSIFPQDLSLLILSFGGKIFDNVEKPTKCIIDQYKENLEVLKYTKKLFDEKAVAPLEIGSGSGAYEIFASGRIGMYFAGRWKVPDFRKIKAFEWDIAPVPKGKKRVTRLSGSCLAIATESKLQKEAWEFVKFYTSHEGYKISVKGGRLVPIYKSLANAPFFLNEKPPEHVKYFVDTMEYQEKTHFFPKSNEVAYKMHQVLTMVVENKLTPEEGIKRLQDDLTKLVKQFQLEQKDKIQ